VSSDLRSCPGDAAPLSFWPLARPRSHVSGPPDWPMPCAGPQRDCPNQEPCAPSLIVGDGCTQEVEAARQTHDALSLPLSVMPGHACPRAERTPDQPILLCTATQAQIPIPRRTHAHTTLGPTNDLVVDPGLCSPSPSLSLPDPRSRLLSCFRQSLLTPLLPIIVLGLVSSFCSCIFPTLSCPSRLRRAFLARRKSKPYC